MRYWFGFIMVVLTLTGCSYFNHLRYASRSSHRVFAVNQQSHVYYVGVSSVSKRAAGIQALKTCHLHSVNVNVCRLQKG
jgi:hypothetical protein